MTTRHKGIAFVLNLDRVYETSGLDQRTGSEIDVLNINHINNEIGFGVQIHRDLNEQVRILHTSQLFSHNRLE